MKEYHSSTDEEDDEVQSDGSEEVEAGESSKKHLETTINEDESEGDEEESEEDEEGSEAEDDQNSDQEAQFEFDSDFSDEEKSSKNSNSGWADAMRKIINSKKEILSKTKKDSMLKKESKSEFEVVSENVEKNSENLTTDNKDDKKDEKTKFKEKSKLSRAQKTHEWNMYSRSKPSVLEKNQERHLAKIATRGVVQLFNTIKTQQKELSVKSGNKEKKRKIAEFKEMDKASFLDMLKGSDNPPKKKKKKVIKEQNSEEEEPEWDVLQDSYMMGGKLKDWDAQDSDG